MYIKHHLIQRYDMATTSNKSLGYNSIYNINRTAVHEKTIQQYNKQAAVPKEMACSQHKDKQVRLQ